MVHLPRRRAPPGASDTSSKIIRDLGLHLTNPENIESLKARFYDAAVRVVLSQPHLQTGIVGETSKKPKFVRLDSFDLRNHIEWISLDSSKDSEAQYLKTMQSNLDAKFSDISTRPGWKIIVLHKAGADCIDVIYVWDHSHHDGMSGKIFHQQLLQNLNSKAKSDERIPAVRNTDKDPDHWIVDLPDYSDKLPPPPEDLCAFRSSLPWLAKTVFNEVKPPKLFPPGDMYAKWAPIKTSPYKTRFRTFTIGHEIVTRVVEACRHHKTTVTGLLHGLALLSLSTQLKEAKGFASRTPYDLRRILPSGPRKYPWLEPKEAMCNYVSVVDHGFDAGLVAKIRAKLPDIAEAERETASTASRPLPADLMDLVWSVSARIRREIKATLDAGGRNDIIGLMKLAGDFRDVQQSEARKPRHLSWLVTNLIVMDGKSSEAEIKASVDTDGANIGAQGHIREEKGERGDGGGWSVRRAELVLSAEVCSAALSVSLVTVKNEQMAVTCSWQDCAVEAGIGEGLLNDLERWMKEIGSAG
ncbi:alcohol acetyltransferase-domain-containing protein [Apiospora rasikravindrae]|uniref:Alcohol acetyltransferase-domain-containing protein n=1 Tax=Apiospora rasikravindrae TaxID=990691 RepID=A0ABR1SCU2_9PEZI